MGHDTYSTVEHGYPGNYLEAYDLCKKNNIKMIFGVEAYYVDDRFQKDRGNYHIILIAKNRESFKQINKIISEANKTGYYYKPRIDKELLLSLDPQSTIVTTACVMSRLFKTKNYEEEFLIPVLNHFKNNFYFEVQSHLPQAEYNKKILELSKKYPVSIIHANDSHYIYPQDYKDRDIFLSGKGIKYEEESNFILDYPDYNTIIERYKMQGVLNEEEIITALNNTLIFDECEDLNFTKEIKMPSIYPNLTLEEKNNKLKQILNERWKKERDEVPVERHKEYIEAIKYEYDIIEKTNMVDYFLLNEKIVDKAVNEYGGVLSRTGRGSCVSFYVNKLLGFTQVDRLDADIPLYPTRFMSITRILETGSLPDIDYNWADIEPVVKASKDILGEDNIYFMIAYGKMKDSSAFRNLCRYYNLKIDEYNEVAKNLDKYKDDPKWKNIIEESKKFIGVIESISPSPCSFVLLDKPISEEIGLLRVGDQICANIDGYTSDVWKYLKNDYLTVSVWYIISKTFQLINKPIPTIKELKESLNNKVWKLYEDGITATLNQVDTDFATHKVKRYKPRTPGELSAFVAAIRPGFHSLVDIFLDRQEYSTGVKEIDEILRDSWRMMIYQESIMKFLMWCGVKEEITYDIIKKIAKKKFKEEELKELKEKLLKEFINKTGSSNNFNNVWQVVEDAASYAFNSAHAFCMAMDSLYCAYLKANYPLEYYTVILNTYVNDIEKTNKIVSELKYFNIKILPIKFRKSRSEYNIDKSTNSIYKGLASVKHLNSQIAEELYQLKDKQYESFIDLLVDIKENTSVNSKQMQILIKLNFFDEFGSNKTLLNIYEYFEKRYKKTHKEKTKIERINEIKEYAVQLDDERLDVKEQLFAELEYLGYPQSRYGNDPVYHFVMEIDTKYTPKIKTYCLSQGTEHNYKIYKNIFKNNELEPGYIIRINNTIKKPKYKFVDGKYVEQDETEDYIQSYKVIRK